MGRHDAQAAFRQVFGSPDSTSTAMVYLDHAVKGFFDNGGTRLYIVRTADTSDYSFTWGLT